MNNTDFRRMCPYCGVKRMHCFSYRQNAAVFVGCCYCEKCQLSLPAVYGKTREEAIVNAWKLADRVKFTDPEADE